LKKALGENVCKFVECGNLATYVCNVAFASNGIGFCREVKPHYKRYY
jgi:hypothetical protein